MHSRLMCWLHGHQWTEPIYEEHVVEGAVIYLTISAHHVCTRCWLPCRGWVHHAKASYRPRPFWADNPSEWFTECNDPWGPRAVLPVRGESKVIGAHSPWKYRGGRWEYRRG